MNDPIKFGRYQVQKLIGEGAMGKVFLAHDPVLNRQVAIKIISMDRQLDEKVRKEYLARFSQEARLSAQLHHPSIVPAYDAGEEGGIPWIAFQYVDGIALDKIIQSKGKLTVKQAVHIALDIAGALQQAHSLHIVHRDIKPANIIIDRHTGMARLTDFGVAKAPHASLTGDGNAMGSPGYMSPEQIEGATLDERSDIFSLGIVLYEMLTGKHPFLRDTISATAYATLGGKFTPAIELVPGLSQQVETIISKCLAPNPDQRVRSAGFLVDLLRQSTNVIDTGTPAAGISQQKAPVASEQSKRAGIAIATLNTPAAPKKVEPATARIEHVTQPQTGRHPSRLGIGTRNSFRVFTYTLRKTISNAFKQNPKAATAWTAGVVGIIILAGFILPIISSGAIDRTKPVIPLSGLDIKEKALVQAFLSWNTLGKLDSAQNCAEALSLTKDGACRGQFLAGLIAFRNGDYGKAFLLFESVEHLSGGKTLLKKNRYHMVFISQKSLAKDRASDDLVTVLAKKFDAAIIPAIKSAAYERPYWPRINAIRILKAGGKRVDAVRIAILDLKYSSSMQTRLQAIRDLGEKRDRRAIPALKEASQNRFSDPFVAMNAKKVLKDVFREK